MSERSARRRAPRASFARRALGLVVVAAACVVVGSSSTSRAEDADPGDIEIVFGDGVEVGNLLRSISMATQFAASPTPIVWDAGEKFEHRGIALGTASQPIPGPRREGIPASGRGLRIPAGRLLDAGRALASTVGVELTPVGEPPFAWFASEGEERLSWRRVRVIAPSEVNGIAGSQGLIVGTLLEVPGGGDFAEVAAAAARRAAGSKGIVAPLPEFRRLLVVDQAPVVADVAAFLAGIPAAQPTTDVRAVPLGRADPATVASLVRKVLGPECPRLAVDADARQLLAVGSAADLDRVARIVAGLDRAAVGVESRDR